MEKVQAVLAAIKAAVADKKFWAGLALGFALGAMHHYFGL